jgi:hypothetical protein
MSRVPAFPVQIVYRADSLRELAAQAPSPYFAIAGIKRRADVQGGDRLISMI